MIELIRRYKVILLVIMIIIANVIITALGENKNEQVLIEYNEPIEVELDNLLSQEAAKDPTDEISIFPIYICGEVNNPGVYYMTEQAILEDLIDEAGGLNKEANLLVINLAQRMTPHSKVYIPKIGEETLPLEIANEMIDVYEQENSRLININEANLEALLSLPGIGEVKGQAIIDYRTENGPYREKEAIQNVSGIGVKTYAQLESLITAD